MKWMLGFFLLIFLTLGGFLLSPSPVDSKAWDAPSPPPLAGNFAPNEHLRQAELLALGQVNGPEDTAVDQQGRVYTGTEDGRIVRIGPDGRSETWVETGGRPLGMVFDQQGNLVVADAERGLLLIDPQGRISVLTREAKGLPFGFTDDVGMAPDGRLYFSDASARFGFHDYRLDLMEMRPHGRLLSYSPETGRTEVLLDGLHFANGVVVAPDGSYVLVSETWKYRILQYHLEGPKSGQVEVFAENLPGFPDNLSVDQQGRYWVAFPYLRDNTMDALHRHAWLKDQVAKLPGSMQPQPRPYGLVVALDEEGHVITSLHDTDGEHLREITSVNPHGDYLYFGSLHTDRIGRLPLSAIFE